MTKQQQDYSCITAFHKSVAVVFQLCISAASLISHYISAYIQPLFLGRMNIHDRHMSTVWLVIMFSRGFSYTTRLVCKQRLGSGWNRQFTYGTNSDLAVTFSWCPLLALHKNVVYTRLSWTFRNRWRSLEQISNSFFVLLFCSKFSTESVSSVTWTYLHTYLTDWNSRQTLLEKICFPLKSQRSIVTRNLPVWRSAISTIDVPHLNMRPYHQ